MTRSDIVSRISESIGMDRSDVDQVVQSFLNQVQEAMSEGNEVFLRGFGTFQIEDRKAKIGRIMSTNEPMMILWHKAPAFKPSHGFKMMIKNAHPPK